MLIFRLIETYEFCIKIGQEEQLIRVEIFQSTSLDVIYKARVWLQTTYNLYPTFMNLGSQGEDLKHLHSSDQLNTDITLFIAENPEWITGYRCANKNDLFELVLKRIIDFFHALSD